MNAYVVRFAFVTDVGLGIDTVPGPIGDDFQTLLHALALIVRERFVCPNDLPLFDDARKDVISPRVDSCDAHEVHGA